MATQVNGHVYIGSNNYDTYDHWRAYMLTHGINFDWNYGNQCYDNCALLYFQYGLTFYLGSLGYAYEAWTVSKTRNAVPPFVAISNVRDIKRGDLLVFGGSWSSYGHVTFADTDYSGAFYDSNRILRLYCVGQNQGQGIGWGTPSNRVALNLGQFIGAFRNTNWQTAPPPQPPAEDEEEKKHFPWYMIARRLRHQQ